MLDLMYQNPEIEWFLWSDDDTFINAGIIVIDFSLTIMNSIYISLLGDWEKVGCTCLSMYFWTKCLVTRCTWQAISDVPLQMCLPFGIHSQDVD